MIIEVLICTIGRGIEKAAEVLTLPRNDVRYLISFQYSDSSELDYIPDKLKSREDVHVISVRGCGLSANRNNAMKHSTGDIIIFADDDNRYTWKDFDNIADAFENNAYADAICFRSATYDGNFSREFPSVSFELCSPPKGYYVRSCEIALRRNSKFPEFDTNFGLGSDVLACGEEEVFIHDLIKQGFKAIYCPVTIVCTAASTTGSFFFKKSSVRRSKGAVLAVIHGYWGALPRIMKYALFNVKGMSRLSALLDMYCGVVYAKKIGRC